MSNRFKFRAWLPSWQEMNYSHAPGDVDWFFNGEHFILSVFYNEIQELEAVVIMQSTGLYDKNGVEIYEGDIVEVADSSCDDLSSRSSHVVEWCLEEDYPAFDLRPAWDSELNSFSSLFNQSCFEIEVIGNIHENPELLESK